MNQQDREINYKKTFRSDSGRLVLEDLKAMLKYGDTVFHDGRPYADIAFLLGRQSVINDILFLLNREDKK